MRISSCDPDEDGESKNHKPTGPKWEWDDTIKKAPEGLPINSNQNVKEPDDRVQPAQKPPASREGGREKRNGKKKKEKKKKAEKSTALLNVIYPTLGKLAKNTKDDQVIESLNQLKTAFDQAETIQPGITHNFIAQVIDTLKRN